MQWISGVNHWTLWDGTIYRNVTPYRKCQVIWYLIYVVCDQIMLSFFAWSMTGFNSDHSIDIHRSTELQIVPIPWYWFVECLFNSLRPGQMEAISQTIFSIKCIFMNEIVWIPIKISLKFVPKGPINNIPALVQIMAWRRPGDKPLSGPMVVSLPMHICVVRPEWVKCI